MKLSLLSWAHRQRVRIALGLMLALVAIPYPDREEDAPAKAQPQIKTVKYTPEEIARKLVKRKLTESEQRIVRLIWLNFEPRHFTTAVLVANCESTLGINPIGRKNRNGTQDFGVFQMNNGGTLQSLGGTRALALNVEWNIHAAAKLKERSGWNRWVCYKKLKSGEAMQSAVRYTKVILAASLPEPSKTS